MRLRERRRAGYLLLGLDFEMTTSPVPRHRPQREPLLLRPLPRHLGHFLALMTDILDFSGFKGQEYNIPQLTGN